MKMALHHLRPFFFLATLLWLSASLAEDQIQNAEKDSGRKAHPEKSSSDHSQMDHSKHDHSDQEATSEKIGDQKLLVKVKGMVCAFCAQGIEYNFNKRDEVKSTKVDLDKMEVEIELHPKKSLSEDVIRKVVTDSGFGYVGKNQ